MLGSLNDIYEEFDIWTAYGLLHSLTILKPADENDIDNLLEWKVCMIFNEHQEDVVDMSVAEALGDFDHIIAWYALWRKWPIQYKIWEWASCVPDMLEPKEIGKIGFADVYKGYWKHVHEEESTKYP